jgi:hypothetical protein
VSEPLEFEDGPAWLMKTDILRGMMFFSYDKSSLASLFPLSAERVREIQQMNRAGERPESLKMPSEPSGPQFVSAVGDDSITRFDRPRNKSRNKSRNKNHDRGRNGRGKSSGKQGN